MDPRSGGPAQGIRYSAPALQPLGCTNEIVCLGDVQTNATEQVGFSIHSLGKAYGIWNWNARLRPWLEEHLCNFDAVIVHGIWQYHCYAVSQAVRKLKAKGDKKIPRVFVMPHGMLDPWFQTAEIRYWKAWRNWLYWKTVEHRTIAQADGLLFTCEQEMNLARTTFRPYSPKQEHNVGYGIAAPPQRKDGLDNAFRSVCPELADRPYLLFFGRLHEKKGVDLLLNAYAKIAGEMQPGWRMPALVIAGPRDGAYAKKMELLWDGLRRDAVNSDRRRTPSDGGAVERTNAKRNPRLAPSAGEPVVHFVGMLQGDAKWGALYGCDAMILPSHQENFGIAIVEAMACGKPVLISDKVNISMEIEHGGAGWVESDTADGILRLLTKWFVADDVTRSELGQNARQCYEQHYQADCAAIRLLDVLMSQHSPPTPLPEDEGSRLEKFEVRSLKFEVKTSFLNNARVGSRLLHVIAGMDPRAGGVCQAIRTTIPELASLGWHNEVVCVDSPSFDYKITDPFMLHKLGPHFGPAAYSQKLLPWLRNNATRFDSIIIHGLWSYHSYAMTHLLHQLKKSNAKDIPKVYVMPHGMLDPWFQRDASRRYKAWRNWWYWKLIEKHVIAGADGLLFTCQKEMELAREPFAPYLPKKESLVGLGVAEPPAETPAMRDAFLKACPELHGRSYILFISRIHPKKGVDLLIEAYAKQAAVHRGPTEMPVLVIAGPKDSDYGLQMQKIARDHHLISGSGASICFPGMLQGDAKWGAFYGCEAFVLPSHQENFGIAVVEALACSKPVLISDQVNIYQEIVHAGAGMVCTDTTQGVNQMVHDWVLLAESKRCEMRDKARRCFVDLFKASNAAKRLADVLRG